MAKFMNKKEQVFDLKLTTYGHYLMSIGSFKPVYYAFYDDNVLYDPGYVKRFERQNEIQNRIKNETQYLESLTLFQNIENIVIEEDASEINFYANDITPVQTTPRKDIFKFDAAIGDAYLNGETQKAPAWKMVALQSQITSSEPKDDANGSQVPQVNINAFYKKAVVSPEFNYNPSDVRNLEGSTSDFRDNKRIQLLSDDPVFYIEELNTETLTENFSIEVFEVLTGSDDTGAVVTQLQRKYFNKESPQVKNNLLVSESPILITDSESDSGSVGYYFDILMDANVNKEIACRGATQFNKESYYIDLDFDCESEGIDELFFDIYGSSTEPEICR